jgi:hypothetical protein
MNVFENNLPKMHYWEIGYPYIYLGSVNNP